LSKRQLGTVPVVVLASLFISIGRTPFLAPTFDKADPHFALMITPGSYLHHAEVAHFILVALYAQYLFLVIDIAFINIENYYETIYMSQKYTKVVVKVLKSEIYGNIVIILTTSAAFQYFGKRTVSTFV